MTVIVPRDSDLEESADADIIKGDTSSVEILHKAGMKKAQAVLALGDDDSENASVVLAVKEVNVSEEPRPSECLPNPEHGHPFAGREFQPRVCGIWRQWRSLDRFSLLFDSLCPE